MRQNLSFILSSILSVCIVVGLLQAQQQVSTTDENVKGEDFTKMLKDEWSYLKDVTDEFLAATSKKTEFETSQEFARRVAALKAAFVNKVNAHIVDKKFDRRVFNVRFKTILKQYDADKGEYSIRSSESIEAPYDIPSLHSVVPKNPYVVMTDSVNRGFRSSALRIRFPASYRWKVTRDEARVAKGEEPNIFFMVRFILDLRQDDMVREARMKILPTRISMENIATKKVYWSENIQ